MNSSLFDYSLFSCVLLSYIYTYIYPKKRAEFTWSKNNFIAVIKLSVFLCAGVNLIPQNFNNSQMNYKIENVDRCQKSPFLLNSFSKVCKFYKLVF